MKDKLIFDTTELADSDNIGAYLRASDGTLLTHTDVGGKKALDVRLAEGVNVEVDLSHVDDSVRLGDGTSFFTSTSENGDISLDVHLSNTSIDVTATDLDIRDLVFATDKVDVTGSTILGITNDVNIADGGNSITVDAVDLDIRDLNAASDSVQSNLFDGAGTALTSTLISGDQALDVNVANTIAVDDVALANTAIAAINNGLAVADTAEDIVASPLSGRKYLYVYNEGSQQVYIGASGVTAATGFPVSSGSTMMMRAGASVDIEFVGKSGATGANNKAKVRTLELS